MASPLVGTIPSQFTVWQQALNERYDVAPDPENNPLALRVHTQRGFAVFCDVLKSNKTITSLDLSHNQLGDLNARLLANAIFWPRKLRVRCGRHRASRTRRAKLTSPKG